MPKTESTTKQVQQQEKEHRKRSTFKIILGVLVTSVNPIIAFYIISQAPNYLHLVTPFIKKTISISNFEGKFNFLVLVLFYFGAFYAAIVSFTIFLRGVLFKPYPADQRDPLILVTCQRILTNSLEQFIIFFANIAYYVVYTAQPSDKNQILTWVILFLGSRVLFSAGYIFGTLINFSLLRQTGFMIGFILSVTLTIHNLGLYNTLIFIS